jgi:hypothetical protein
MNRAELRRFIVVALPCSLFIALAASAAVTAALPDSAVAPGSIGVGQHWHATYEVWVCGERQPNFPTWESGVHTHADGIIHIHPFQAFEEGRGARLVKFFEYGGGLLTQDEMRMPGSSQTIRNGLLCPDGVPGVLGVAVNGNVLDDWMEYIPEDGDRILITFGPEPDS